MYAEIVYGKKKYEDNNRGVYLLANKSGVGLELIG